MITSMYDFRDENGNIMPYEQYEERKIMEAAEIAEKMERGEIKGIPFEEVMRRLDETIRKIEEEQKNKIKKEEEYVI